jgi:hypothetical protein
MAFEDVQAEIGLLLTQMQTEPADRYELYLLIMQKLNELKAYGMPLPEDLVELEERLEAEFEMERSERAKSSREDQIGRRGARRHRS